MIKINNVPCINVKDVPNEIEFILLHKLIDNEYYREHYLDNNDSFKYIVLDNSAFELGESLSDDLLVEWAHKLQQVHKDATIEIIIPDVYGDKDKTLERMNIFLERKDIEDFELMGVPQGKDEGELIKCLEQMEFREEINTIGVNKLWNREHLNESMERCIKQIHLLGLNNLKEWGYDYGELDIRSADSRRLSQLILGKEDIWEDILTSVDLDILKRLIGEVNKW